MSEGDAEVAEGVKAQGNALFGQKKYQEAIRCYEKAIELSPNVASYYGNRAAAYIMLYKYEDALQDCRKCVQLDPQFIKGYLRLGKVLLNIGDFPDSVIAFEKALELDDNCKEASQQLRLLKEIEDQLSNVERRASGGDPRTALYHLDKCLQSAPHSIQLNIKRVELLIELSRHEEAAHLITDLAKKKMDPESNYQLIVMKGQTFYYEEKYDKAQQMFNQALRLNPDCKKAQTAIRLSRKVIAAKQEANEFIAAKNYAAAYDAYTAALQLDPSHRSNNAKLHCNRALALIHIGRLEEAEQDCETALQLQPDYENAKKRLGQVQRKLEKYEASLKTFEELHKSNPSREHRSLVHEAKLALKKSKRKCYYKILGVTESATDDEIKKGYKKKAMLHHPDRHSSATQEVQKKEEKAFKDVGEAYSVLTDPQKKRRYDAGEDLEDMQSSAGHGFHTDPNEIFAQFFGGGMGGGGFPSFQQGAAGRGHNQGFTFSFG